LVEVVDGITRAGLLLSLEIREKVVPIEMYLEILPAGAEVATITLRCLQPAV
jgi:hypothetical protein